MEKTCFMFCGGELIVNSDLGNETLLLKCQGVGSSLPPAAITVTRA
jgi:hypothetical protein